MNFLNKYGGLPFVITLWLLSWKVLGFEPTVVVMLASIIYGFKEH